MPVSRQVRRAEERLAVKKRSKGYQHKDRHDGSTRLLIHRNRKHRSDKFDYFRRAPLWPTT